MRRRAEPVTRVRRRPHAVPASADRLDARRARVRTPLLRRSRLPRHQPEAAWTRCVRDGSGRRCRGRCPWIDGHALNLTLDFFEIGGKVRIWHGSSTQARQGVFPAHPPRGRLTGRTDSRHGPAVPLHLEGFAPVFDVVQHLVEALRGGCCTYRRGHAAIISDYPIFGTAARGSVPGGPGPV